MINMYVNRQDDHNGVETMDCSEDGENCAPLTQLSSTDGKGSSAAAYTSGDEELQIKLVKACVYVALQEIINQKLRETCFGCSVDHPSQMQHSCLFEADDYYFKTHIEDLKRRLYRPPLLQSLLHLFGRYRYQLDPQNVKGAVEAIVYELEDVPHLYEFKSNYILCCDLNIILETLTFWEDWS